MRGALRTSASIMDVPDDWMQLAIAQEERGGGELEAYSHVCFSEHMGLGMVTVEEQEATVTPGLR